MKPFSCPKKILTSATIMGLFVLPGIVNAGNTITITDVPALQVHGNSSSPDGTLCDLAPVDNTVNVNVSNKNMGMPMFYGAFSTGVDATGNTVVINATNTTGVNSVVGARVVPYSFELNNATNNHVVINGGADYYHISGGTSDNGNANDNTVTLKGGAFNATRIFGGYSRSGETVGEANNNKIIISGGLYTYAAIQGGFALNGIGKTNNNIVSITGSAVLDAVDLRGGGASSTGNILNIGIKNAKLTYLLEFDYLNFYLPANTMAGDVVLNFANWYDDSVDIDGMTVTVGVQGTRSVLTGGDEIILINTGTQNLTGTLTKMEGVGMSGLTLQYEFDLRQTENQLIAKIRDNGAQVRPQTKVFSEGRAALVAATAQGGDLLANGGIQSALESVNLGNVAFGALSGGYSKYKTGSHVSLYGASGMVGYAKKFDGRDNRTVLGIFAEFGGHTYDTENDFGGKTITGDGNTMYYGGGALARFGWDTGAYLELGGRIGLADGDFDSSDMTGDASYDSSSLYYGGHVGLGYIQMLGTWKLDAYAKFMYTAQTGDDVTLDTGEIINFGDAKSSRGMLGARLGKNSLYAGVGYIHEFNGDINARTSGLVIDTPSLGGGSFMGEVGYAKTTGKWTFDLGARGYAGIRMGAGLSGSLRYKF